MPAPMPARPGPLPALLISVLVGAGAGVAATAAAPPDGRQLMAWYAGVAAVLLSVAVATSMLADLREMENRHDEETVLGDLLHPDHRTAQAGRPTASPC